MIIRKRRIYDFLEKFIIVLGLLLLSRAFVAFFEKKGGINIAKTETNTAYQMLLIGIFGLIFILIIIHFRRFLYTAFLDKGILFLVGFASVSVIWSPVPSLTAQRVIVLLGATVFGIYIAMRYNLREQMYLFAWMLGIAAILSTIIALAMPEIGVQHNGLWQGIFGQKNALGRLMALNIGLLWLLSMERNIKIKSFAWGGVALSLGLTWLSFSATSLLIVMVLLILIPVYRSLQLRDIRFASVIISGFMLIGSIVFIVALANIDSLLAAIGKNPTFSARIPLWSASFQSILQRPWLGYGFGGFWLGFEGASNEIWRQFGWHPSHAHNGYLDLWLDLGMVGLGAILVHFFINFLKGIRLASLVKTPEGTFPLFFLTFVLVANSTYSLLLSQYVFFWALYVAVTLSMNKKLQHLRGMRKQIPLGEQREAITTYS